MEMEKKVFSIIENIKNGLIGNNETNRKNKNYKNLVIFVGKVKKLNGNDENLTQNIIKLYKNEMVGYNFGNIKRVIGRSLRIDNIEETKTFLKNENLNLEEYKILCDFLIKISK